MNFETTKDQILPFPSFAKRQFKYLFYSLLMVAFSLFLGTLGYFFFANLSFIDSFYNAAMILTGMGPVNPMATTQAKLFSSFYALFSGIAFLSTSAIFFTPIAHRFLHYLHLDNDDQ
jgi:hypothetical protein